MNFTFIYDNFGGLADKSCILENKVLNFRIKYTIIMLRSNFKWGSYVKSEVFYHNGGDLLSAWAFFLSDLETTFMLASADAWSSQTII